MKGFTMHVVRTIAFAAVSVLALSGCQTLTQNQQSELAGTVIGAGAGLLLADAFDANPAWTVGTALAGAAIGQQVARNNRTGECAYYQGTNYAGQAVYRVGPC
jgi:osmotically inducible lipoprotein OsmB